MSTPDFSDIPLENIDQNSSTPPKRRVKDSRSGREIFSNLLAGDEPSAARRQRVQAMLDGTPPYDDAVLRNTGQGFRTNINFGEGAIYLEEALSAYVDLINSTDKLVQVETTFGEPKQKKEWNRILSEEYSFQLRKWERFNYEYMNLCHHFVGHGVGINYHEASLGWPWRSSGLGDFLIPRGARALSDIEVSAARRSMTIPELYSKIKDKEAAKKLGWNVEAVIRAIKNACSDSSDYGSGSVNWEKLQEEIKNNDLFVQARTAKIKVVHMWAQEFDGTVSHMIILEDEHTDKDEFLMYHQGKYRSNSEAFTFFTYGIGTNGSIHSVRGLGHKIFSQVQLNNRMRSQSVDSAMLAASPMVQPTHEGALEDFAFNFYGPFAVLPPDIQTVDRAVPNLSNTMVPVMKDLDEMIRRRTGAYSSQGVFGGDQRKTRFEVAAQLEQSSKLTATSQNLFYHPWDEFHIETSRRFHDPEYSESIEGWEAVSDFRERCLARGVPMEAIQSIDYRKTRAVRAIGNGSQATRIVQLQQLNEIAGTFDPEGRHSLFRDQAAAIVGQEAADRYIPARPDSRTTQDHRMALLETNDLLAGREFEPFPDDLHLVHLDIHVPKMEEVYQQVEAGQMELVESFLSMEKLFHHSVAHLELMQQDPSIESHINNYNARLQQLSEIIVNGAKAHQKMLQEQQEAQAQGGEQGQPDPKAQEAMVRIQTKLAEAQAKLKMMEQKHQLEMMQKLQKHQQDLAIQDAKNAAKVKDLLK